MTSEPKPKGRPKGVKETRPRIRRADVLSARREEWDKWERNTGALKSARRVLLQIINDEGATNRDRLKAIEMLEDRGLGKTALEREPAPVQILQIVRSSSEGFERLNPGNQWEATTVEALAAELPEGSDE